MQNAFSCFAQVEKLEALAADFTALREGRFNIACMQEAPVLQQVSIVPRPVHFLEGCVTGHPLIPDGRQIVTSQLWGFMVGQAHYARTMSRWYRISDYTV